MNKTTYIHKDMDPSQKYQAELKKSDTKEYILNYFTYETNKTSRAEKVDNRKIHDCFVDRWVSKEWTTQVIGHVLVLILLVVT